MDIDTWGITVTIRRVHFKDGKPNNCRTDYGGAIENYSTLNLQSCIFSGNRTDLWGGTIYNEDGVLNIQGCTFYNNRAHDGGAIFNYKGTVAITGNIFYGNTANYGNIIYSEGTVNSGGYNVYDTRAGFDFDPAKGDVQTGTLPFSPVSFRLLNDSDAAGVLPSTLPVGYPTIDFYGNPISGNGAAGAAQGTVAAGYLLDYGKLGKGTVTLTSGSVDADGIVTAGSTVTLEATPVADAIFLHWTVNGVKDEHTGSPLQITMDGNKSVRAVFADYVVNSVDDKTVVDEYTTLREAINAVNIDGGGVITFDASLAGDTITLTSALPDITQDLTIEGNGVTISGNNAYQIMNINASGGIVTIRRVHFKDGHSDDNGGAIENRYATLNLQSCIFSGNSTNNQGGAIYNQSVLNIQGCTFYNNRTFRGGTIYNYETITLAGNIFYGNTATTGNIIYNDGTVNSGGYNVYDNTSYMFEFDDTKGDKQTGMLPFSPVSFRLLSGSDAAGVLSTLPVGYPTTDFYGDPISSDGAAGAVQGMATAGYFLDYGKLGNGTVTLTSGSVDAEGIVTAGSTVTLEATPEPDVIFLYWTVNGVETQNVASLPITMDGNKIVRAVFAYVVNNVDDNTVVDEYTTLREAINAVNSDGGGAITFDASLAGQTITLVSSLPQITQNLIIEGNGITVSGNNAYEIMRIASNITVTIRRVHFKDGKSDYYWGGAIENYSNLNLQSCIFSGNSATYGYTNGGAIYNNNGILNIQGCTFYNNRADYGGAIINYGTVILAGNIFYGNTATYNGNIIYSEGTVNSYGYNVYDNTSAGFDFGANDIDIISEPCPFDASTFVPASSAALNALTTLPVGYPAEDFYGEPIIGNGAAGAVQVNYLLDYGNIGNGTVTVASGSVNVDGIVATGSTVTLTATPATDAIFSHWMVNGVKDEHTGSRLLITLNGN
jgi:hypothetical protein